MPFATVDGTQVYYHAPTTSLAGANAGRRVLYVHGTGCNGSVWERHRAALTQGDPAHSTAAIDLPGHGRSEGTGYRGVADYAHAVLGVADQLGWDRFVLAGHSLGGGIVLAAALYAPDRLDALMMIDSGARLRVDPQILDDARRAARGESVAADPRLGFAKGTPDSVVAAVRAGNANEDPAVTLRDWIADDTCDFLSRVGHIPHPTLAICGDEDALTPPKYHHFLRDHMPDCRFELIEGAGHWTFAEQPDAFDAAVRRFLDGLGGA